MRSCILKKSTANNCVHKSEYQKGHQIAFLLSIVHLQLTANHEVAVRQSFSKAIIQQQSFLTIQQLDLAMPFFLEYLAMAFVIKQKNE
jgi:hypothetical protein